MNLIKVNSENRKRKYTDGQLSELVDKYFISDTLNGLFVTGAFEIPNKKLLKMTGADYRVLMEKFGIDRINGCNMSRGFNIQKVAQSIKRNNILNNVAGITKNDSKELKEYKLNKLREEQIGIKQNDTGFEKKEKI